MQYPHFYSHPHCNHLDSHMYRLTQRVILHFDTSEDKLKIVKRKHVHLPWCMNK